jgi:hypothetical protein
MGTMVLSNLIYIIKLEPRPKVFLKKKNGPTLVKYIDPDP